MRLGSVLSMTCVVCMLGVARIGDAASASAQGTRDVWVEVRINDVPQPDFALLHIDLRGHLFVRVEDLRAWRMKPPDSAGPPGGLVRIDDIPGLRARLDAGEMLLHVEADPSLFTAKIVNGARHVEAPDRGVPAVFLGYNLFAEHDAGAGDTYSALVQAGSSLGRASFASSWLGSRIVSARASQVINDEQSGWHRLDTALLLDFPEYTARFTVGDSVTGPGTLGDSVRFTGLHWTTDYTTRPGLTPYALPIVSGTAAVPSSVELYVNNALVQRTYVDAGPFQLNNVPVPVGEGSVDIRIRDMTGRLQQLSVPYLVTPQLIAAGLTTIDLAAGAVREDYGIEDFAYGPWFVSGAIQHGLNSATTVNAAAEVLQDQLAARGGVAFRMTRNVTVDLTPAVSHAPGRGTGGAVAAGIDAQWSSAALGVHYIDASPDYLELGGFPGERLHTQWAAQASTQLGHSGSLALLYASRRFHGSPTTVAATLSYSISLRKLGSLSVFVSDTRSGATANVIGGITFTRYLGKAVTASVTDTSDNGSSIVDMQIGRSAPPDAGWGWELAHARGGGADTDGLRIDARSAYGVGSGEIDSTEQGTLDMLSWQGGLVWAGGRPWPAQTLTGPAALVVVPDLGGVAVLHDGQPVGHTDSEGRILVPALRAFEDNTITVVPEDIPLTAMLDSDKVTVRPYSHGIVSATMSVSANESRVFTLLLAPDIFVPAGAEVVLDGHTFPVGTQGVTQLPVARSAVDAMVSWPGGRCRMYVPALSDVKQTGVDPPAIDCRRP